MSPYRLFKFSQSLAGKGYNGTSGMFNSSKYYNYFCRVVIFLDEYVGKDENKQKEYISVCAKEFGNDFSPFSLDSSHYKAAYEKWVKVNGSVFSYTENIIKSCRYVYKFCKENKIYNLEDYIKKWGVSHFISGRLNENLAVFLNLHEINMSKPEKTILNRRFLKNVKLIKERIERENRVKNVIKKNAAKIQQKLTILKERDKILNQSDLQP